MSVSSPPPPNTDINSLFYTMNVHCFRQIDYSISQIEYKWVSGVICVGPNNKLDKKWMQSLWCVEKDQVSFMPSKCCCMLLITVNLHLCLHIWLPCDIILFFFFDICHWLLMTVLCSLSQVITSVWCSYLLLNKDWLLFFFAFATFPADVMLGSSDFVSSDISSWCLTVSISACACVSLFVFHITVLLLFFYHIKAAVESLHFIRMLSGLLNKVPVDINIWCEIVCSLLSLNSGMATLNGTIPSINMYRSILVAD